MNIVLTYIYTILFEFLEILKIFNIDYFDIINNIKNTILFNIYTIEKSTYLLGDLALLEVIQTHVEYWKTYIAEDRDWSDEPGSYLRTVYYFNQDVAYPFFKLAKYVDIFFAKDFYFSLFLVFLIGLVYLTMILFIIFYNIINYVSLPKVIVAYIKKYKINSLNKLTNFILMDAKIWKNRKFILSDWVYYYSFLFFSKIYLWFISLLFFVKDFFRVFIILMFLCYLLPTYYSFVNYNLYLFDHKIFVKIYNLFNLNYDPFFFDLGFSEKFFSFFVFGFDGITLMFLLLTVIIFFIIYNLLGTKKLISKDTYTFMLILIMLLEVQLIITFSVQNLLLFYIFFESTLIPMFLIVGFFGSRSRKVVASFYLFLYTILGSLFLLVGIIIVYSQTKTFFLPKIYTHTFSYESQLFLWFLFFLGFAVKLPSIPFHLWLPEAHVEAPTIGSIILAAILLKLGGYGLLRVSLKMFPEASLFYQPFVFTVGLISIIYASLTALRQTDIKRIIAYSSIAHMNFTLIGLFCFNKMAYMGAFYMMFGHGIVSGGLFLLIGLLYDRYSTRSIFYYGGLMKTMPFFCFFFLVFNLSNLGFPGLVNFIGEFLIMLGIAQENIFLFILSSLGFVLSGVYSIWLYNRVAFGNVKVNYLKKFKDLVPFEINVLIMPLFLIMLFLGIYSAPITDLIDVSLSFYILEYQNFFLYSDGLLINYYLDNLNYLNCSITLEQLKNAKFNEILYPEPGIRPYYKDNFLR